MTNFVIVRLQDLTIYDTLTLTLKVPQNNTCGLYHMFRGTSFLRLLPEKLHP